MNILDPRWKYVPACSTNIASRWPTLAADNEARRKARQQNQPENVTPIKRKEK